MRRLFFYILFLHHHGRNQQCHDVQNLNHGVDGWAGRVLVRIADSVTSHGSLVGKRFLAAKVARLNILLGVVPSSAA